MVNMGDINTNIQIFWQVRIFPTRSFLMCCIRRRHEPPFGDFCAPVGEEISGAHLEEPMVKVGARTQIWREQIKPFSVQMPHVTIYFGA